jgi:hypothetical protein
VTTITIYPALMGATREGRDFKIEPGTYPFNQTRGEDGILEGWVIVPDPVNQRPRWIYIRMDGLRVTENIGG